MAKSLLDSVGDPCAVANAVLAIIRGLNPFMSFKHVIPYLFYFPFLCNVIKNKIYFKY